MSILSMLIGAVMSIAINAIAIIVPSISIRGVKDGLKDSINMMIYVCAGAGSTVAWALAFYNFV